MYKSVDVSVVILNQNQGVFLERCIRSCLAQTLPGRFHEVLVVDIGSKDYSREVIHSYGRRVVPVFLESDRNLTEAASAGLKRTNNARYVVLVRSQDFLADYMILFQSIWLFQNHDHDGISVDYWMVDPETDTKVKRMSAPQFPCPYGIMYRKEVFVREGLYESSGRHWTLDQLQEQLTKKYRIGHLDIPFYRLRQDLKDPARHTSNWSREEIHQ